jgi:lipoprotein-releasing system permease protein
VKGIAPFEWIAALRFLREGRMQTIFIIAAVAIGVGVIVFMSAMLSSLQANFLKRVLTSSAHIQILRPDEVARPLWHAPGSVEAATIQTPTQRVLSIDQWRKIMVQLRATPNVTHVAAAVTGSALAVRGAASRSISVVGVEPESYFEIVRLPDYIVLGQPRLTVNDVVIGIELAKDLGVTVGDKLILSSAFSAGHVLTVTGLFDLGSRGANKSSAYVALRNAQALTNLVGGATSIEVTVADIYNAEIMAREIAAWSGLQVISWITSNAQFFTAVQAQQSSNTVIRLFVGLSVAFGIASVLVVSVIQRSKDIGILRAMGTRRGQILRVFLLQGGLLGLVGAVVGAAAGAGGLLVWHHYMRQADGTELFPLSFEPSLFIGAIVLAAITGVAAASVPAIRAARLEPVVAIRG